MSQQNSDPLDFFNSDNQGAVGFPDAGQPEQGLSEAPQTVTGPKIIQKRPADVYTLFLILSFIALSAAAIFLAIELNRT